MAESFVQVAVDGAGKQIDAVTVTPVGGTATYYRQTTTLGDASFAANVQGVGQSGDAQYRNLTLEDLLTQVLVEMRVMNLLIHSTQNSRDDLDALRYEVASVTTQSVQ